MKYIASTAYTQIQYFSDIKVLMFNSKNTCQKPVTSNTAMLQIPDYLFIHRNIVPEPLICL